MSEVVVTGIGLVTPLGCSREKTWRNVMDGQSVVNVRNAQDFGEFNAFVRTAPFLNPNGVHRIFPITLSAVQEALGDAGISVSSLGPDRTGCSISVSKPVFEKEGALPLPPDSVNHY